MDDIAGILYYKIRGRGVCGQTMGADGSGTFMKIYYGDKTEAYEEAKNLLYNISLNYRIVYADYVENEEGYYGPQISITQVKG